MQYPQPGWNFTPAYQISGLPYALTDTATGSPYRVQFPYVTKFITIKADGAALQFGFTANGTLGTNHFAIANNEVLTMEIRVKEMYISGSSTFHLLAGLTGIPTGSVPTLVSSYAFSSSDPYFTGSNAFTNVLTYEGI